MKFFTVDFMEKECYNNYILFSPFGIVRIIHEKVFDFRNCHFSGSVIGSDFDLLQAEPGACH